MWPELPVTVAELPPPGLEARQLHAGRGEDHLRDVQQEGKQVSRNEKPCPTAIDKLECTAHLAVGFLCFYPTNSHTVWSPVMFLQS